jgi:hypothetical protein
MIAFRVATLVSSISIRKRRAIAAHSRRVSALALTVSWKCENGNRGICSLPFLYSGGSATGLSATDARWLLPVIS